MKKQNINTDVTVILEVRQSIDKWTLCSMKKQNINTDVTVILEVRQSIDKWTLCWQHEETKCQQTGNENLMSFFKYLILNHFLLIYCLPHNSDHWTFHKLTTTHCTPICWPSQANKISKKKEFTLKSTDYLRIPSTFGVLLASYHCILSMGPFKEWPIHLHSEWRKLQGILKVKRIFSRLVLTNSILYSKTVTHQELDLNVNINGYGSTAQVRVRSGACNRTHTPSPSPHL